MELFNPVTRPKNITNELAKELDLHPVLVDLLVNKGIENAEEADKFLHPRLRIFTTLSLA